MSSESHQKPAPQTRKVFDSIYGFISFPKEIWRFIDTPYFQRLRNIKQLGCLSWVFPGGCHSRFQHSLGTGHLAQKYITSLIHKHTQVNPTINKYVYKQYTKKPKENQGFFKSIIDEAIFTVTLAGLLHDIGHGPFSHLFDSTVVKDINNKQWQHEIASLYLIDGVYQQVIKQLNTQKADPKEILWLQNTKKRVKSLIIGKVHKLDFIKPEKGEYKSNGYKQVTNLTTIIIKEFTDELLVRPWEFELISNRITGIDVDKLDYFRRDAYYLGAKNIYIDHELLINETLILENPKYNERTDIPFPQSQKHRLCYPTKYSEKVYDVFYSRYKLYKTYYLNLKAYGIEFMLGDILTEAESFLELKKACTQLLENKYGRYIRLTDSILERIEYAHYDISQKQNQNKELTKQEIKVLGAGDLLAKLKKRNTYDFVKECHLDFEDIFKFQKAKDLISQVIKDLEQQHKDFKFNISEIGFGIKDRDPFEECKFYDKTLKPIKIAEKNDNCFSMLKPKGRIELSLRIYLKNRIKNPSPNDIKSYKETVSSIVTAIMTKTNLKLIAGESGTFSVRAPNQGKNKTNMQKIKEIISQDKKTQGLNKDVQPNE